MSITTSDLFTKAVINRDAKKARFVSIPSDQKKSRMLAVMLTQKEREIIKYLADKKGMTLSNVVRLALRKYIDTEDISECVVNEVDPNQLSIGTARKKRN